MIFREILFLFSIPFSFVYLFIVTLRNIFYSIGIFRSHKINAKVISVGNITWGGTGKTPVTAFIADIVTKKNHRASILIRGYGNDESELIPKLTGAIPVFVGKDRVKKGMEAINDRLSDTLILDDGFQYRRLRRDLDIVCIDAGRPFGNGWLIPSGSLRETPASLRRADIFLITKADLVSGKDRVEKLEKRLRAINPVALIVKAIHRPLYFYRLSTENSENSIRRSEQNSDRRTEFEKVNIGELQNRELVLVSAIGRPEDFEKTVLRLGLKINKHFIFRDHHAYTKMDIARIEDYCGKNKIGAVVTTEKDAVKLKSSRVTGDKPDYLVLKVRLEIVENEDGFYNRLFGIYDS